MSEGLSFLNEVYMPDVQNPEMLLFPIGIFSSCISSYCCNVTELRFYMPSNVSIPLEIEFIIIGIALLSVCISLMLFHRLAFLL